jgi:sortase A
MLRRLQIVLWIVAACAILTYSGTVAEESFSQAYLNWEFAEALDLPALAVPPNQVAPYLAQPLGRLEIPSIELSAMFAEGMDGRTLRRAVGHIPGTALPGSAGNVGLSGHRDTFFRRLGKIHAGDVIWLKTLQGTYKYVAESSGVVDPDESVVLRDIGRPTLTLITCYPFYYVGHAPKRFVVHASLVTPSR